MFRSVFTKYITAFMLIIIVSFGILTGIVSSLMFNYSGELKRDVVYNSAGAVRNYISKEYRSAMDAGEAADFGSYLGGEKDPVGGSLSVLSEYTGDLAVMITDQNGRILAAGETAETLIGATLPENILKSAQNADFRDVTDLGGMLAGKKTVYMTGITDGNENVGYVIACSDDTEADHLVQILIRTIVMACLWVMLAALIAVYFISDRIIQPLKEMSDAAKSFAKGQFDVRVPIRGHDEVAELAVAFNNMASSISKLEQMRSTFLANVSHDLRTPMTTISGFIDGIIDGAIPKEKHEYYLNIIGGEVRRLSRLISTLLDISRIQAGDRKFNSTSFDICEMARLIVISFEQKISEKNLDVEFEYDEDKMLVYADRDAIYQILYNICDNAVKFSKDGGKYRIRLIGRDRKVYVSVYNEGQGIPEEELPYVFDRFYKSDRSRGLDKSGVGLGLYIAKAIIDAHGEEIWVKSVYGEYCEFVFTLSRVHEGKGTNK